MDTYGEFMDANGKLTSRGEAVLMHGLDVLSEAAWRNSEAHGFHDSGRSYLEELFLVHSEISEAGESWRKDEPELWFRDESGNKLVGDGAEWGADEVPNKAEGMSAEAADAFIRLADINRSHGWSLGWALVAKMRYNVTRPFMHGKKA